MAVSLIDAQDYGNGGLGSWEWMNDDGAPIAGGAGAEPRMVRDHLNHDLGLTGLFRALP